MLKENKSFSHDVDLLAMYSLLKHQPCQVGGKWMEKSTMQLSQTCKVQLAAALGIIRDEDILQRQEIILGRIQ